MPQRYSPDDAREWLNRARSDLALTRAEGEDVYVEDLCFHAQQASEKAIKAVLIHRDVEFSYVHDIAQLLTELEGSGQAIPDSVKAAARLTRFAVFTRYPSPAPTVQPEEWQDAVAVATQVVDWAEDTVTGGEEAAEASGGEPQAPL